MTTALYTHDRCLDHAAPEGHPERPDRLRAVLAALEGPEFQDLVRLEAPEVTREQLERAHDVGYLDELERLAPAEGMAFVDSDTVIGPNTLEAARLAAGAAVAAVDAVIQGEFGNAFCATRPPGHHAERRRAMGFCYYSNAAVAALHAIDAHFLQRVAVVDFDVHHGNGTQDIFERDGRLFYGSTHEWPLFPGTGAPHEVGVGNVVNLCLPALSGSIEFREAFGGQMIPALERFRPELVIISAGFDAHGDDPLAQLLLNTADFGWATERLCEFAAKHCRGRVVSTLEGGYDLRSLAQSAAAHVRVLMAHGVAALATR